MQSKLIKGSGSSLPPHLGDGALETAACFGILVAQVLIGKVNICIFVANKCLCCILEGRKKYDQIIFLSGCKRQDSNANNVFQKHNADQITFSMI